uniref:Uncharacterized protein n=1 Tax=Sus scrofa TaxID=9823 RepID=A0A8D1MLE1_PIG
LKGMRTHRCDCQSTVCDDFNFLIETLNNQSSFKNIYEYAFNTNKGKMQRILTLDTKNSLVTIILVRCYPFASFFHYHNQTILFLMSMLSGHKMVKRHSKIICSSFSWLLMPDHVYSKRIVTKLKCF